MIRWATPILLLAVGVMLALNVARSLHLLSAATTRNPATIAITSFLAERGPPSLLALEQHVLHYLKLAPYAFVMGLFASLAMGHSRAIGGVLLWIAFALTFTVLLCVEGARWDGLSWYSLIPDAIGDWCTVPIYIIGVAFGCAIRQKIWPKNSLIDLLIGTTVAAMIFSVALASSRWMPPIVFLLASGGLAWRLSGLPISQAENTLRIRCCVSGWKLTEASRQAVRERCWRLVG